MVKKWQISKSKIWRIGALMYGELMLQQIETAIRLSQEVEVLHA
jgi:hypothetical protein